MDLPGLVSGQVPMMVANATHLWASTGTSATTGNFGGTGTGLLQGTFLPNGTAEWNTHGWTSLAIQWPATSIFTGRICTSLHLPAVCSNSTP